MQILALPSGNMSPITQIIQIIQIRNLSALEYLDHAVGLGNLSDEGFPGACSVGHLYRSSTYILSAYKYGIPLSLIVGTSGKRVLIPISPAYN